MKIHVEYDTRGEQFAKEWIMSKTNLEKNQTKISFCTKADFQRSYSQKTAHNKIIK